jgi:hypothetical protein
VDEWEVTVATRRKQPEEPREISATSGRGRQVKERVTGAAPRRRAAARAVSAVASGQPEARADSPVTEPVQWLVLVYRVPSEPTRLRAAVWRRLKSLGAIYLQNSVAALPADPKAERALRTLRNEIVQNMSGRAQLLSSTAMVGEADLLGEYNAARNDEYEEILDKCQDFRAEIEKETAAEHFTYGELEENEEDLAKLLRWHEKVKARDVFGATGAQTVEAALESCRTALDEYARRVYEVDSAAY